MTKKVNRCKDKKNTHPKGRQTPKDVQNEKRGIRRETKEKPPYVATKEENSASKHAPEIMSARITNVKSWIHLIASELAEMNLGKPGRPFLYCNTMFVWFLLMLGDSRNATFADITGKGRGILESHDITAPSISTVHRRLKQMLPSMVRDAPPEDSRILCRYVTPTKRLRKRRVAVDSTGLTAMASFQYMAKKWDVEQKVIWLKLHSLVDVDSGEIIAFILTYNDTADSPMLPFLLEMAAMGGHRLSKVYGDGAYGCTENWKCVTEKHGAEFVTSFAKNSNATSDGCLARGRARARWCELPYDEWVEETGYGRRWRIEGSFGDYKRLESENLGSRTDEGHILQVVANVVVYNERKIIRADLLGITRNGIDISSKS